MRFPQLRPASLSDLPFLEQMLFEAAFWRPALPRPALEVGLQRPDLAKLLLGWGRCGDTGFVAVSSSSDLLGAGWYRHWSKADHSYGFVSVEVPELAIGVRPGARGQGVGALLLRALLAEAERQGIARVSLSVETDNPARRLYERMGFERVGREGNAWTMVAATAGRGRSPGARLAPPHSDCGPDPWSRRGSTAGWTPAKGLALSAGPLAMQGSRAGLCDRSARSLSGSGVGGPTLGRRHVRRRRED